MLIIGTLYLMFQKWRAQSIPFPEAQTSRHQPSPNPQVDTDYLDFEDSEYLDVGNQINEEENSKTVIYFLQI